MRRNMRGKKTDSEFLSDFISRCVQSGFQTSEAIVDYAKTLIAGIDDEIKKVEKNKIIRSKLLGVIDSFEKPNKTHDPKEIRALSFFKIQNIPICKMICFHIIEGVTTFKEFSDINYSTPDFLFCVKQLLEERIIARTGNYLLKGEKFDEYLAFLEKGV